MVRTAYGARMRWCCCMLFLAACDGSAVLPDGGVAGNGPKHDGSSDATTSVDGTPTRLPCTSQFGTAMTPAFGRLDGFLVAIVPPGSGNCQGDSSHVHLQVKMNGAIYDLAVNVGSGSMQDVQSTTRDIQMPGIPWSEGWHPNVTDDYASLGVHSADLPPAPPAQLTSEITSDLASANHISVFATGYGPGGGHLVHHNGSGHDGMIVTMPLANMAHVRLFSFSSQTF